MEALILTIIATSIPLLLAATGELIAEKSGILNLGVEGMMLSGAVGALGAVLWLENPYYGIVAGALSGVLMASIFSIFTINFIFDFSLFETPINFCINSPERIKGIAKPNE